MIEIKDIQAMSDKEQFHFLMNNPQYFILQRDEKDKSQYFSNVLMYVLAISQDIQDKLSYKEYLKLQRDIALKNKNLALFNDCNLALKCVEHIDI